MNRQILSVFGLYVYDKTLFDLLQLPEGVSKETFVDNLILELGEFETIYPDSEFMKHAIGAWSGKELRTWDELYKTLNYEYDPISNYDRTEEMTYTKSGNGKDSGSSESVDNAIGKVAAYNSTDFENANSAENSGNNSFENDREYSETFTHTGNTRGNVGVTTTQEMIEAQRDVVKFNIYDYIIDSFKSRFCVLVY